MRTGFLGSLSPLLAGTALAYAEPPATSDPATAVAPNGIGQPTTVTPPRAADYRHKLSNGATAFLVEDHDFPLISISILVKAGDYLEPVEKTGLAQLTGSQMRSGGTKSKKPNEFDEETAFLAANIKAVKPPLELLGSG